MPRGKGEGAILRVPADKTQPLRYWEARIELPPHKSNADGTPQRRRKVIRRKDKNELIRELNKTRRSLQDRGDLPTASQTVTSWFDYWLREIAAKNRRPSTMNSYRSIVARNISPKIGKLRLSQVTPTHVRALLTGLEKEGAASTTLRNTFSVLSAGFGDAERDGRMNRNPCDLMEAPRKRVAASEVLTADEVVRLLNLFRESPDAYMWATFLLTGARRGEVIGLEWDRISDTEIDLSWQLQRIVWAHGCGPRPAKSTPAVCGYRRAASCPEKRREVPADYELRQITGGLYWTRPKSTAGWRIIPLVEPLSSILRQWRVSAPANPYGLVFTTEAGLPVDPDSASRAWPEVRAALGVDKGVRLHGLRHSAIDMMYRARVPEADIIRIFGHSTVQMSRSYRSTGDRGREIEAMVRMSESLGFSAV
jgi:integrase